MNKNIIAGLRPTATAPTVPKLCGVSGCAEECTVYLKYKNIARCAKHYQQDVDNAGRSASQYIYQHGFNSYE